MTKIRRQPRPSPPNDRPVALTIAGSDPSGGAGVQADLKVFALHGVYGCSVLTGLTAQNTLGVQGVHPTPARFVTSQLDSVLDDVPVRVAKTGMLWSTSVVKAVVRAWSRRTIPLVVDPVMVAKGGDRLLREDAERAVRDLLLPIATLITPNLDEASALLDRPVRTLASMRRAARDLVALGAGAALVKGGHLRGTAVDVLFDGSELIELSHPRIPTQHSHGTGCVLSAAVCARLARGDGLRDAVSGAVALVAAILDNAAPLGQGRGPADPLLAPTSLLLR